MYKKTYITNNAIIIDGFEEPVRLPDRPHISTFRNYGKEIYDQKFHTEAIIDIKTATQKEIDAFVTKMWHHRINGDWWLIGGKEVYIPGYAWFFFNAWTAELNDNLPEFRMEAVEFFTVAEHIIDSKVDLGLLIVKPRRIGETEKVLCLGYDMCTRYRYSRFGMQNIVDVDAKDNFLRIVAAHKKMMFCFKPQHKGADEVEKELVFRIQGKNESERYIGDQPSSKSGINSIINYKPTVLKAYDGKRLRCYHLDEYGKIPDSSMPVLKQWNIIKECLVLKGGSKVVGKAFFTTTVEDIKDGGTIANVSTLWTESDPTKPTGNGRTLSGLKRYMRPYTLIAAVDEFGFHKKEEATAQRESEITMMEKEGKHGMANDYRRRYPADINDALSVSSTDSVFEPAFVETQLRKLRERSQGYESNIIKAERYKLSWSGVPFYSDVVATPSEEGRFHISLHPVNPNNRSSLNNVPLPGNIGLYAGGIDGYDHKEGVSDGGFSIFMPFNPLYEDAESLITNEDGSMVPVDKAKMKTNRFVLTYRYRHPNPDDFYMDTALALFYYGVQALPEQDKPGVMRWYEKNGIYNYLAWKPKTFKFGTQKSKEKGVKATGEFISLWLDGLTAHFAEYYETYGHENLLNEYKVFNGKNRTKLDILVSAGYAHSFASKYTHSIKKKHNNRWNKVPA